MFLGWFLPEDTKKHLRNSCKEQLLAVRSIVDSCIEGLERRERSLAHSGGPSSRSSTGPEQDPPS